MKAATSAAATDVVTTSCPNGRIPRVEIPDIGWVLLIEKSHGVKIAEVPAFHTKNGQLVTEQLSLRPTIRQKDGAFSTTFALTFTAGSTTAVAVFRHTEGRERTYHFIAES